MHHENGNAVGATSRGGSIRAVLIDLDRTLIDVQSYTDYPSAIATLDPELRVGSEAGSPETEWPSATAEAMEILVVLSGRPGWQAASDHIETFERDAVAESHMMPGAERFTDAVASVPHAVVTLMGPGAAQAALAAHGLRVPLVSGRNAMHRPKPAPDQMLDCCARMGVDPSDVVMVGDSSWDAAAAAAAGCGFVGVTNDGHSLFPDGTDTVLHLDAALDRLRAFGLR